MLRLGRLPALPPTQSTDRQLLQVRRVIEGVSPRTPMVFTEVAAGAAPAKAIGGLMPLSEPPMPPRELSASSVKARVVETMPSTTDNGATHADESSVL